MNNRYIVTGAELTSVADAIRSKGGTSDELTFPDGFVSAVDAISAGGGGDTSVEDSIVDRSISGAYVNNRVTTIGERAFTKCQSLTSANFSAVYKIGDYAFAETNNIETVNCPAVTNIGTYAFYNCKKLNSLIFPNLATCGDYAFYGCAAATSANTPLITSVTSRSFYGCAALHHLDFHVATKIESYALYGCQALGVIILRRTSVCSLANTNALTNTPFASGKAGGKLLIPSALVTQYQNATNWTTLYGYGTNKFLALEDYTVDGTTTGAIDWDKLNAA